MSIIDALVHIQSNLKAPKDQNAGRYRYRNIEDINQAVKPLAAEHGCAVTYTDNFKIIEGTSLMVCESTCILTNSEGEKFQSQGCAIVNTSPKGMSIEQACGAASSYARKYAACGLFAIDSSENDPDRTNSDVPEPDPKSYENVDIELVKAKKRLWDAVAKWAELNGVDPKAEASTIQGRDDYRPTRAYLSKVAEEYEKKCRPTSTISGQESQGQE